MKSIKSPLFDRDTLLHLRLPFSFFLLPVFIFGVSQAGSINVFNTIIIFIILHLFIYPGSNVYNSYMDKDKGSIGGLKNPPLVTIKLYYASLICDVAGLLLCFLINWQMMLMMLVYIGVSKAYSWKKIRLKKYGVAGWLVVMLFQGGYTFFMVNMATENIFNPSWLTSKNLQCMVLSSLLIGGFYPLTQIYQHLEDSERGDKTISFLLGIMGTFVFTAVLFLIATSIAYYYFEVYYGLSQFLVFILTLLPVTIYFLFWFYKTWNDEKYADYTHTMRMTFLSSVCMIICFSILLFLNHS